MLPGWTANTDIFLFFHRFASSTANKTLHSLDKLYAIISEYWLADLGESTLSDKVSAEVEANLLKRKNGSRARQPEIALYFARFTAP